MIDAYLLASQVGNCHNGPRCRATWSKPNCISCNVLTIDGEIRADSHRQWHRLLVQVVVLGVLLDDAGDVVNGGLVSLAANDSVLVGRIVCEALEEVSLLLQGLDLDAFAETFL